MPCFSPNPNDYRARVVLSVKQRLPENLNQRFAVLGHLSL